MSILREQRISRRSAIAGVFASWALLPRVGATAQSSGQPPTVDLGQGLEIRDYRLFPTQDAMRFIVEIHNTTDNAVDTPAVGVVLPSLSDGNYGWANPISPVLHPHTSDCLIGIAPASVKSDENWDNPNWIVCSNIESDRTVSIQGWQYEFSHSIEIVSDTHTRTIVEVTNHNSDLPLGPILQGLVRDGDGRLAGSLLPISLAGVSPGETQELEVNLIPSSPLLANPFSLINSVAGVQNSFSVQPRGSAVNGSCNAVMPWNK